MARTERSERAPLRRRRVPVHLTLMATMLVWGLNLPLVKVLTGWFDSSLIATLRMLVACVTLGLLLAWRRQPWPRLSARQWAGLAACAWAMVYLNQILFAAGMQRTSAANAALIMATAPMISGLAAALAFGERLRLRHAAAVLLGFGGVAVVVLHKPGAALAAGGWGDLLVLGCVVAYAGGGVLVQRLSPRIDSLALSSAIYGIGTLMLVLHLLATQGADLTVARVFPGAWPWLLVLLSGVLATALGNWAWNGAIGQIGIARAALFIYWVPVFGMASAALWLGEPLNGWYGLGLLMVLAGSRLTAQTRLRA